MLIQLSGGCYVETDNISEIKVDALGTGIIMRINDGIRHHHEVKCGKYPYDAMLYLLALADKYTRHE